MEPDKHYNEICVGGINVAAAFGAAEKLFAGLQAQAATATARADAADAHAVTLERTLEIQGKQLANLEKRLHAAEGKLAKPAASKANTPAKEPEKPTPAAPTNAPPGDQAETGDPTTQTPSTGAGE